MKHTFYIRLSSQDGGVNYTISVESGAEVKQDHSEGLRYLESLVSQALSLGASGPPQPKEGDFGLFKVEISLKTTQEPGPGFEQHVLIVDCLEGSQKLLLNPLPEPSDQDHRFAADLDVSQTNLRKILAQVITERIDPAMRGRYRAEEGPNGLIALINLEWVKPPDFRLPDPTLFGRGIAELGRNNK